MKQYLLLLFLLIPCVATAAGKAITIAGDPWPPYISENHPEKGMLSEVVAVAFHTQGYDVKKQVLPTVRAFRALDQGDIDALIQIWWNRERETKMLFSNSYFRNKLHLYCRKDNQIRYKEIGDLSNKIIGVVRGYYYGETFRQATSELVNPYEVDTSEQGLMMLSTGMLDMAIAENIVAQEHIQNQQLDNLIMLKPALVEANLHLVVDRNNPRGVEIVRAFNSGLEAIIQSGQYQQILARYGLNSAEFLPADRHQK